MAENNDKLTMEQLFERLVNDESWEADPEVRKALAAQLNGIFEGI